MTRRLRTSSAKPGTLAHEYRQATGRGHDLILNNAVFFPVGSQDSVMKITC
jgi:hypothetical protein